MRNYIPNYMRNRMPNKALWVLVAAAVVLRLLAAQINAAYQNDVLTFQVWAANLYASGLSNFYGNGFTDYPPVYMYVLYAIGALRAWLDAWLGVSRPGLELESAGLESGIAYARFAIDFGFLSPAYNLLIRLPAIACDAATGCFIYRLAARKINRGMAAVLTAAYLFNPAIILDSAVWGQIDAVYTLLLCVSLYYIHDKKLLPAYGLYGVAILTKPQSLILAPIYLYSAYAYLREASLHEPHFQETHLRVLYSGKSYLSYVWNACRPVGRLIGYILSAIILMLLLALPFTRQFNFMPLLAQYYATLDSYAYGSVNAYNFFALIGGNWAPLSTTFFGITYTVWGFVFIALIVVGAFFALSHRHLRNQYFLIAAALNTLTFMFSIKMHERYLFPSLTFFLVAFIYKRDRRILWLYAGFSAGFFLNCVDVLRMIMNGNALSVIARSQPAITLVLMGLTVFLLYTLVSFIRTERQGDAEKRTVSATITGGALQMKMEQPHESEPAYAPPPRLTKRDFGLLIALITVYTVIALINLGDTRIPQTTWSPKAGELAIIDLGEEKKVSRIQFMMGAKHDASFIIYASRDGQEWIYDYSVMEADVFAWTTIPINERVRYIEVIPYDGNLMLQEFALRDDNDALLPVVTINPDGAALVDEQHLVPVSATFMNSTYFDEIYHARTAYEYIHGILAYENTHPPLGKDIIALGVLLFGMTPFGWRLPGTVVGILMIPLLYQFARYVLRSNRWAFFAAFIFTFDFMHFTQTRIATIDTYIVYFVIGMYYYMYRYIRAGTRAGTRAENHNRVSMRESKHELMHELMHELKHELKRRMGFLFMSGLFMGMAIASKWQGVYAAIGLPLLFFPAWFPTFKANKKAAFITLAACVLCFILVPAAVYTLAYIPFMHGAGGGIVSMINNQRHMFWYHSTLVSEHSFSSHWWEWPLITRPVYYYSRTVSDTLRQGISSFGNPAVWWFGIVATIAALYRLCKKPNYDLVFLLVGYSAQYLPWVLVSRTTYMYHYFPSVPFVVLLIACFFKAHSDDLSSKIPVRIPARVLVRISAKISAKIPVKTKNALAYMYPYRYAYLYAGLVFLLFALFYPVLSGLPFPVAFVHRYLRWLPGWVLM